MPYTSATTAQAILFDMDGTLIDSTPAVEATWASIAEKYNLDVEEVLKSSHGIRTVDNLKKWCGITDEEELKREVYHFESEIVNISNRLKAEGKRGLMILPGAQEILSTLNRSHKAIWAIVTSATIAYAGSAIPSTGLPTPPHLITAEDIEHGKPHPDPYLAGAKSIDADCEQCIVVEDAPSGIKSGIAAGSRVLAVCTSHKRSQLEGLGAEWIVTDLSRVHVSVNDGLIMLEVDETP